MAQYQNFSPHLGPPPPPPGPQLPPRSRPSSQQQQRKRPISPPLPPRARSMQLRKNQVPPPLPPRTQTIRVHRKASSPPPPPPTPSPQLLQIPIQPRMKTIRVHRKASSPPPPPPTPSPPPPPSPQLPQIPIPPSPQLPQVPLPPLPLPSPPLPPTPRHKKKKEPIGNTCTFCNAVLKNTSIESRRKSYCGKCETVPGPGVLPRFKKPIVSKHVNDYMKGVFESFVAEIEVAPSFYGFMSFDKLYEHVRFHSGILTPEQLATLLEIINEFEGRWGEYVEMVLNQSRYMEISGSGNERKEFKIPSDWAAAIRNLIRVLADVNNIVKLTLSQYLEAPKGKGKSKAKKSFFKKAKA